MRLEFEPNAASTPMVENGLIAPTATPDGINFDYLLAQGIKAAQNGDREQARTMLTNATQVNPRSEDAWMWLASISDYPEELLAFLQRALDINPENAKALSWHSATRSLLAKTLVQRAIAAYQDGSPDLAHQCLNEALALDNNCEPAWIWKASLSTDESQRLEFLERVLEINDDNHEARGAIDSIRTSKFDGHMHAARVAFAAGDHEDGLEILDQTIGYAPDKAEPWLLKSHFLVDLDQKLDCLKKVLELEPADAAAQSAYDFLLAVADSADTVNETADPDPGYRTSETTDTFAPTPAENGELADLEDPQAPDDFSQAAASKYVQDFAFEEELKGNGHQMELSPAADITPIEYEEISCIGEAENAANPPHEQPTPSYTNELATGPGVAESIDVAADTETHGHNSPDESSWPAIIDDAYATQENLPVDPYDHQDQLTDSIPVPPDPGSNGEMLNVATECPFCAARNDVQVFECGSCHAMLTLSDLESLLANSNADHEVIRQAVTQMEAEWNSRDFSEDELIALAIGNLNVRNYVAGHKYLQEASRLNPNNVILSGQVNALAIRVEELNRASEGASAMPQGRTILVVDDSATVRKLISAKLEKSGHNVICAQDGVEALARIAEEVPDLVLLDITMPRMDGYEVCKNIRSNPAAQAIPVVMISGKDGFFDKVRGRMAGTTGYVTKPFGPETLMKALETYLVPDRSELS